MGTDAEPGSVPGAIPSLASFVPQLSLSLGAAAPAVHQIEGSLVFADVSGFTAMSEKLAGRGRVGAEEVTDVISTTFASLLELSWKLGGGLLKFGGDALLLAFTGEGHPSRAAAAAAGMRSALRSLGRVETSAGPVRLRLSTGVASGSIVLLMVGESSTEMVVAGPTANAVLSAESAASAGQVLLDSSTASCLSSRCLGRPLDPGVLLARAPRVEPVAPRPVAVDGAERFVPARLRAHLLAGGGESEHRQSAVGFVHVDGFDDLIRGGRLSELSERLHSVVASVQRETEQREVCFLASDVSPGGAKLILTAGVPDSHGQDDERLLAALRAVTSGQPALPVRAGVHSGPVFSGMVGPPFRRAYTVMGDTVNTAARVAYRSEEGQVLATPALLDRCSTRYALEWKEAFAAKGKAELVEAAVVGEPDTSIDLAEGELAVVGRAAELTRLRQAVTAAIHEGSGGCVAVTGAPGLGASHLIRAALAGTTGARVVATTASPADQALAFHAIRPIVAGLLGLGRGSVSSEDLLLRAKSLDPESGPWVPLLAPVLGVAMDDSPESGRLEHRARAARQRDLLTRLIRAAVTHPTVAVIEHVDDGDPASADLVDAIAAAAPGRPLLVILSGRERPSAVTDEIVLTPLSRGESEELALMAGGWRVQAHHARTIAERAEGVPTAVVEMARAVARGGDASALPHTVEALATARIDGLPPVQRQVLRRLAVLGGRFSLDDVALLLPDVDSPLAGLHELVPVDGDSARFASSAVQAAAYEGLAHRAKRELHARMAQSLAGDEERVEAVALHAAEGRLDGLAWVTGREAARRARQAAAFAAAAGHLRRALGAASRIEGISSHDLGCAWTDLSLAQWVIGDLDGAAKAASKAGRLLDPSSENAAQLHLQRGLLAADQGRLSSAKSWFAKGLRLLPAGASWSSYFRVRYRLGEARILDHRGKTEEAIAAAEDALGWAEEANDEVGAAHAHNYLCGAKRARRDPLSLTHGEKALAGFSAAGDLRTQGAALINLGAAGEVFGLFDDAADCYTRAMALFDAGGDVLPLAIVANNLGVLLTKQGHFAEADRSFGRSVRVFGSAGSAFEHVALLGQARVAAKLGEGARAANLLQRAAPRLRERGMGGGELVLAEAECSVVAGDLDHAREGLGVDLGDESVARLRLVGVVHHLAGDQERAREAMREAVAGAMTSIDPYEELLALENLVRLGEGDRTRVEELRQSLGIVAFPEPLMVGQPR
jgi:class 3 adenylate cyclase/tetratricopeptide (TPR) repeat protein